MKTAHTPQSVRSAKHHFYYWLVTLLILTLSTACTNDDLPAPGLFNGAGLPNNVAESLAASGVSWLPSPLVIGDHPFLNQHGETTTIQSLQGKWSLAFFGFTFCPDICPMTLSLLRRANAAAVDQLAANTESSASEVNLALISVDPERDQPAALAPYLSYFDPNIVGFTGNPESLAKLTTELHGYYSRVDLNSASQYTMDHSANIVVISPNSQYLGYISPPHSLSQLTNIIRILSQLQPANDQ